MMKAEEAILELLDGCGQAFILTQLVESLKDYSFDDLKAGVRQLYEDRRINRVTVRSSGKPYYVFYSLYLQTVSPFRVGHEPVPSPTWASLPSPVAVPVPVPEASEQELTEPMRKALIERLETDLAVPERRGVERRNLTALDVIDRWKLSYRLSRVIEIISTARKVPLTKADAVSMAKLIREHVRGQ